MALSDFMCGCTAYPCWAVISANFLLDGDPCATAIITTPLGYVFAVTSFISIVLQSAERYVAIFYPFWYREKLTSCIVLLLNGMVWVISCSFIIILLVTKNSRLFNGILGASTLILFIVTVVIYLRILKEVRRIEKHSVIAVSVSSDVKFKSESKVTKVTAMILCTFGICFGPMVILSSCMAIIDKSIYSIDITLYWFWALALLNSFFNPVVICRQLSALRKSVAKLICFWKNTNQIMPHGTYQFQGADIARSRVSHVAITPKEMESANQQTSFM